MNYIISFICAIVILNGIRIAITLSRYNKFKASISEGDLCRFYVGETSRPGMIAALQNDSAAIRDEYDEIHLLPISQLYPL